MLFLVLFVLALASVDCLHPHGQPVMAGQGYPAGEMYYCSDKWSKCYYVSEVGKYTHDRAAKICAAVHTYGSSFALPVPINRLVSEGMASLAEGGQFWLGITDNLSEGTWHSDIPADRTTVLRYTNWYTTQTWPEPNGGKKAQCAFATHTGQWFDSVCNTYQHRVICERNNHFDNNGISGAGCQDSPGMSGDCANWRSSGHCHDSHVSRVCKKTCGLCPGVSNYGCQDKPGSIASCLRFKKYHACNAPGVKDLCPKTCGVCGGYGYQG